MSVDSLTIQEVSARVVERLGLNPAAHDALSPEAAAAALRRAASFLCPTPPGELVDAVLDALRPLDPTESLSRDSLGALLDLLIASGDLLELRQSRERASRLLYLGPPTFVAKVPGEYLLLGVRPEGRSLVDDDLSAQLRYDGHRRSVSLDPATGPGLLKAAGLQELRADRWLRHPRARGAAEVVSAFSLRLDAAIAAGAVDGLEILDPTKPVHYYRGRWRPLDPSDSGDFVGRRPQAYGAAAWCVVRVVDGQPTRLVDLPAEDAAAHARDEAWRLQAAIDAARQVPQRYRLREVSGEASMSALDLFGPVPSWAARHLDLMAMPIERRQGALFSYLVHRDAIPDVATLLTEMLWMQPRSDGGAA